MSMRAFQEPETKPLNPDKSAVMRLLEQLFGEEQVIVLVIDDQENIKDYRIEPLADVMLRLSGAGFGTKLPNPFSGGQH